MQDIGSSKLGEILTRIGGKRAKLPFQVTIFQICSTTITMKYIWELNAELMFTINQARYQDNIQTTLSHFLAKGCRLNLSEIYLKSKYYTDRKDSSTDTGHAEKQTRTVETDKQAVYRQTDKQAVCRKDRRRQRT